MDPAVAAAVDNGTVESLEHNYLDGVADQIIAKDNA
jgi:hypothetical protein